MMLAQEIIDRCSELEFNQQQQQEQHGASSSAGFGVSAKLLPSQIGYIEYMRQGKTAALTDGARQNDHASHAELNKLRALPCNSTCFDCTALKPGWAVLPHGVFICIDCAQTHRDMGRHVSQTKAIDTGTYLWYPAELAVMREVGNTVAAAAFAEFNLPRKPSKDAKPAEKVAYSQAKYGRVSPDFVAAAARLRAATPSAADPSLTAAAAAPATPAPEAPARKLRRARLLSNLEEILEDALPTPMAPADACTGKTVLGRFLAFPSSSSSAADAAAEASAATTTAATTALPWRRR
jgi:ADP-ribosylation factor GTPase-activating protein 2/3